MNPSLWERIMFSFILSLIFSSCYSEAKKKSKLHVGVVLEEYEACLDNGFLQGVNVTYLGKDNYAIYITFHSNVSRNNVSYINDFEKCESRTSDTCERLMSAPLDDLCGELDKEHVGPMWPSFLNKFEPPLKCPFLGTYQLNGYQTAEIVQKIVKMGSIDASSGDYLYRWFMRFYERDTNKEFLCLRFAGRLKVIRG